LKEENVKLIKKVEELMGQGSLDDVCKLLHEHKSHYDWVGVYLVHPDDKLVLGPYHGEKTIHTEIPFGEGVCGLGAVEQKTIIVDDVCKADEYLSCSPKVKSEIVVPITKNGEFIGEIDIDSHRLNAFDKEDKDFLEKVSEIIGKVI